MRQYDHRPTPSAFTLIEILLVMALLTALMAITYPAVIPRARDQRAVEVAHQMKALLVLACALAEQHSTPTQVVFDTSNQKLRILSLALEDFAGPTAAEGGSQSESIVGFDGGSAQHRTISSSENGENQPRQLATENGLSDQPITWEFLQLPEDFRISLSGSLGDSEPNATALEAMGHSTEVNDSAWLFGENEETMQLVVFLPNGSAMAPRVFYLLSTRGEMMRIKFTVDSWTGKPTHSEAQYFTDDPGVDRRDLPFGESTGDERDASFGNASGKP